MAWNERLVSSRGTSRNSAAVSDDTPTDGPAGASRNAACSASACSGSDPSCGRWETTSFTWRSDALAPSTSPRVM